MRRLTLGLSLCSAAVSAGLVCSSAATAAPSEDAAVQEQVLRLTAVRSQATLDAPNGMVQGARLIYAEDLYNDKGAKAGHLGGVCTVTSSGTQGVPEAQCNVTESLPGGEITAQGFISTSVLSGTGMFDDAITGGTGIYSSASGTIHGVAISTTTTRLTFHIGH
ncbi:allene oxide cyclase barrel-like domain-containing protein [Actinacidiphila bryophytorum]|uniref:Allene oxide cyclase barrel-like domain-containing protein n=1 Tax=Actinacidiphila bryophytorum TaxID=1436133 RepID=A0A9W4H1D4_9ACTN|nr:hypothetical protein [Actinacidiphila bryophytorum]MBM9435018.1 hypothetical protein [Actinacidiphila bryophytorum]MBN6542107.1 hypothetical protein [Actinacidiphila bryophytorum]CAG7642447.1 conserved exported hypothetical protein [Actinacidiphila bryophytorum]